VNRFEAIDKLYKVQKLIDKEQFGQAMLEIGMNDDQFPEGQSLEELIQAFQVRVADLMRVAGVK
jgi:hypothetical protein